MAFTPPPLSPDPIVHVVTMPSRAGLGAHVGAERALWSSGTPAGTWPAARLPVPLALALGGTPPGLTRNQVSAELDVALRTWSRPTCSGFRAGLAPDANADAADDGVNLVVVHTTSWPTELVADAPAQTVLHTDEAGNLRDADVHLNAVRFRFVLGAPSGPGEVDLRSVLVHEIGHVLGLGHAADARATMAVSGSGVRWRSLEQDDVDGVCALYPGAGDGGCDARPCPESFACVGGACQRAGERADLCAPCDPSSAGACEGAGDGARCIDPGAAPAGAPLAAAGSVCGRPCAREADCGRGFACRPTTAAGDLQCVAADGCRSAASACAGDGDCPTPWRCAEGACVGPLRTAPPPTAASPAIADAGDLTPAPPSARGSGCAEAAPPTRGVPCWTLGLALAALVAVRARRR